MAGTNERVAAALQGLAHEASVGKDGMCVVRVAPGDAPPSPAPWRPPRPRPPPRAAAAPHGCSSSRPPRP